MPTTGSTVPTAIQLMDEYGTILATRAKATVALTNKARRAGVRIYFVCCDRAEFEQAAKYSQELGNSEAMYIRDRVPNGAVRIVWRDML